MNPGGEVFIDTMYIDRDDEMVLTPTYHLFKMYIPHQGAEYLPLHYESKQLRDKNNRVVNTLSATASRADDGTVTITLANVDLESDCRITIALDDDKKYDVSGSILTSKNITDHNTFENPECIKTVKYDDFKSQKGSVEVVLPTKSIVTLTLK